MSQDIWMKGILDYARNELQHMGLAAQPVGASSLAFLSDLHAITGNRPHVMKMIIQGVAGLVDKKPMSPITEADFVEDPNGTGVWRCTRYPHVYKARDGKVYNDRAVVYKPHADSLESQYIYQGNLSSKREITLPYAVKEHVVVMGGD